jgi:hypothetical protein
MLYRYVLLNLIISFFKQAEASEDVLHAFKQGLQKEAEEALYRAAEHDWKQGQCTQVYISMCFTQLKLFIYISKRRSATLLKFEMKRSLIFRYVRYTGEYGKYKYTGGRSHPIRAFWSENLPYSTFEQQGYSQFDIN